MAEIVAIDPFRIYVDETVSVRGSPYPQNHLVDLAKSLMEMGQLTPVPVKRMENGHLKVVRHPNLARAARMVAIGFVHNGKIMHDPTFKMKCIEVEWDEPPMDLVTNI
jgi:hypothetical protein